MVVTLVSRLAPGGGAADADEQPRPEVAERPDDLVVYGGTGRAARSWAAFDAIVRELRSLGHEETLLVQSGKPVGIFRTHEWAPGSYRQFEAGPGVGRVGGVPAVGGGGLTVYGQMTAGSWIYIAPRGSWRGPSRPSRPSPAEVRRLTGGDAWTVTAGLGGMGGAQPLAITMNGGVALVSS